MKSIKIKLYPTLIQKQQLNKWFDTSRFVFNKSLEYVKKTNELNHGILRDKLITYETKKYSKNDF